MKNIFTKIFKKAENHYPPTTASYHFSYKNDAVTGR